MQVCMDLHRGIGLGKGIRFGCHQTSSLICPRLLSPLFHLSLPDAAFPNPFSTDLPAPSSSEGYNDVGTKVQAFPRALPTAH